MNLDLFECLLTRRYQREAVKVKVMSSVSLTRDIFVSWDNLAAPAGLRNMATCAPYF